MEALVCRPGETLAKVAGVAEALELIREDPLALVWLDFKGLSADDISFLSQNFDFHELALEDAEAPDHQRSKVEEYDDHFFLVMHSMSLTTEQMAMKIESSEIDLFVGANYVVSVHHGDPPEIGLVRDNALKRPGIMAHGSDRLAYYLLDAVVDRYMDMVDSAEDTIDQLEDAVIDPDASEEVVQNIFRFKRETLHFRKHAGSLREAVNQMTSREFPHIQSATEPYLRDVYDHLVRLSEMLDTYRDIMTGALDVRLSAVSNRLNSVMEQLTLVATIFMPLTFLTGFWGMNFVQLPFGDEYWFWGSLALMIAAVIGMLYYFRRRRWM